MTPREHAAFNAGIAHAASLAQIAAVAIEIRDDARKVRQQAAIEALRGLADALKDAVADERSRGCY